ncbi:sentrin-specific protease 1-like [Mya arenaria]|uniref:sentrin-specific protease 1-like n=1 Tax=Mya arenaria TaxID=6604 RepID=UPI0022DF29D5|nr:sentrin-specific protease 1-like [Mya arenaria]
MLNSFTKKVKNLIFSSNETDNTLKIDRKRKRPNDDSDDRDDDGLLVKKVKLQQKNSSIFGGLFSASTVQTMSDWVQKKTPNLFHWNSNNHQPVKHKPPGATPHSGNHQGNGFGKNGSTQLEGDDRYDSHRTFGRVDAPIAYRQGTWPVYDPVTRQPDPLSRAPLRPGSTENRPVQTDYPSGMKAALTSSHSQNKLLRTRNPHMFTAKESVRLDEKARYQQLLQKFTTVQLPLENKETEGSKKQVRVPELPRFYFRKNDSILSSTVGQDREDPSENRLADRVRQEDSKGRQKEGRQKTQETSRFKVQPTQKSTPRPLSNGTHSPGDDSMIHITDISAIPKVQPDSTRKALPVAGVIDLTDDDCEKERNAKGLPQNKLKFPTDDYRSSQFLSDVWIKNMMTTYNCKARERDRQVAEAEIKAKVFDEKRQQDELELEKKIRVNLKIYQREPVVIEEPEISEPEDEVEVVEEEEERLPELTVEMDRKVSTCLSRSANPEEVLVDKFRLQITRRDIHTLAGLNWLNDEVINFYMNLLMERGEADNKPSVYAFNTFFYPKVTSSGHSAVRRWTRRVDVLGMDYIIIPVHLGMHWCLAIIDFKKKQIRYYDSMGGGDRGCLNVLQQYLCDESKDKKKKDFDLTGWTCVAMKDIPQQQNGSDCGMFACKFAEYVTREAPISFTQENMPYFRRRMVYEIVTAKLLQ